MKLIARFPTEKFDRVANKFKSAIRFIQSRVMRNRLEIDNRPVSKTEFQQILEECLAKLSNGTSTVEESLARYPQHADELRPLLRTVYFLNFKREEKPAFAYNHSTRAGLARYWPSRLFQTQGNPGLFLRTSVVFAMLAMAILVTGTAGAQSALPGDGFYGWKKMSEEVWRAFSSDRVATEIAISNRRITEMLAVANDPERSDSAMEGYLEALSRLKSVEDDQTLVRIAPVLVSQQQALREAGIVAIELNNHLVRELRVLPPSAAVTVIAPTDVPAPTGPTSPPSQPDPPEDSEPVETNPTRPDTDPTEPPATEPPPVATEPPPTAIPTEPPPVPTEPPPTTVPTEPPPVPTEPPPTTVPTEPPPVSTEPPPTTVPTEPPPAPTETESTPVPPDPGITTPDNTNVPGNTNVPEDAPPVAETPQP